MNQYYEFKEDIDKAVKILKKGGLILYPTDTIWGIGCDATNEDAVTRIYRLKNRTVSKFMLILLDSDNRLNYYIEEVPEIAWELIDVADSPLTIVYPGARNLAKNLIAPDGSIGIRITSEEFCTLLIRKLGKPLVSTSANISGKKTPSTFPEIEMEIIEGVDYVVKYRQEDMQKRAPSGIIRLGLSGQVEILRK